MARIAVAICMLGSPVPFHHELVYYTSDQRPECQWQLDGADEEPAKKRKHSLALIREYSRGSELAKSVYGVVVTFARSLRDRLR
jgi:hypothetical protein